MEVNSTCINATANPAGNSALGVLFAKFRQFWEACLNSGVTRSVQRSDLRYVHFTNIISILTIAAITCFIGYSLAEGMPWLALKHTVDALCIGMVLWFNKKGQYMFARYAYITVVSSCVLVNACYMGHVTRVHEFFYVVYMVPFLLFRVKDYLKITLGVVIVLTFFMVYYSIYPLFTAFNFDLHTQHMVGYFNGGVKFVLFGVAIYLLAYYNYSSEKALENANHVLLEHTIELNRSNEDLEQFAYIISHDLKTPVRNINSFLELLRQRYDSCLDADGKEYIEYSRKGAVRLSKQIDDLLVYCRVGRNLPPSASVDMNVVAQCAQMQLAAKIELKKAKVVVEGKLPVLHHSHQNMMLLLLHHLVDNALKFNTADNPFITISASEDGQNYVFSITDNGIGIDSQYNSKLFFIFRRLHTESEFEGAGTGLAICRKILNLYKGRIWFTGETGKGTTFHFCLPKADPFTATDHSLHASATRNNIAA